MSFPRKPLNEQFESIYNSYRLRLDEANKAFADGNLALALETINLCIDMHPSIPAAYVVRADVFIALYKNDHNDNHLIAALADYTAALAMIPKNAPVLVKRAKLNDQMSKIPSIIATLKTNNDERDVESTLRKNIATDMKRRMEVCEDEKGFRYRYQFQLLRHILANNLETADYQPLIDAKSEEHQTNDALSLGAAHEAYLGYSSQLSNIEISTYYFENAILCNKVDDAFSQVLCILNAESKDDKSVQIKKLDNIIEQYETPIAYLFRGLLHHAAKNIPQAKKDFAQFLMRMDVQDIYEAINYFKLIKELLEVNCSAAEYFTIANRNFADLEFETAAYTMGLAMLVGGQQAATSDIVKGSQEQKDYQYYCFMRCVISSLKLLAQTSNTKMSAEKKSANCKEAKLFIETAVRYVEGVNDPRFQKILQTYYSVGKSLFNKQEYEQAARFYEAVINFSGTIEYYTNYGEVLKKLNQSEKAKAIIEKGFNFIPTSVMASYLEMSNMLIRGETAEQKAKGNLEFEKIKDQFFKFMPKLDLTVSLLDEKIITEEKAALKKQFDNEIKYEKYLTEAALPPTFNTVSRKKPNKSRFPAKLEAIQAAIALFPDYAEAHLSHAILIIQDHMFALAEQSMERAIAIDPAFVPAYDNLIKLLSHSNRSQQELEKLVRKQEKSEELRLLYQNELIARHNLYRKSHGFTTVKLSGFIQYHTFSFAGQVALYNNKIDLAIHHFTMALQYAPDEYIVLTERAYAFAASGKLIAALSDLDKTLDICKYPKAFWLRAVIHAKFQKKKLAKRDMENFFRYALTEELEFFKFSKEMIFEIMDPSLKTTSGFHAKVTDYRKGGNFSLACSYLSLAILYSEGQEKADFYSIRAQVNAESGRVVSAGEDVTALLELDSKLTYFSVETKAAFIKSFTDCCLKYYAAQLKQANDTGLSNVSQYAEAFSLLMLANFLSPNHELLRIFAKSFVGTKNCVQIEMFNIMLANLKDRNGIQQLKHEKSLVDFTDFVEHFQLSDNKDDDIARYQESFHAIFSGNYISFEMQRKLKEREEPAKKTPPVTIIHPPRKRHVNQPRTYTNEVKKTDGLNLFQQLNEAQRQKRLLKEMKRKERLKQKLKEKKQDRRLDRRADYKVIVQDELRMSEEKKSYLPTVHNFQPIFSLYEKKAIVLFEIEKILIGRIDDLKQKVVIQNGLLPADKQAKLPIFCLVGGSVQERYRDVLLNQKSIFKKSDEIDIDATTTLNESELLELIKDLKPFKTPHVRNLYQIRFQDENYHFKIDIRFDNQKLYDLKVDASRRVSGYFYMDNLQGIVSSPLGQGVINDLVQRRVVCNSSLKTIFTGEDDKESSDENLAPLRILIYIYQWSKYNQSLDEGLRRQMIKDKELLRQESITAGSINAKMKKLFLQKRAFINFEKLLNIGILGELFADIQDAINNDLDWLRIQMVATDRTTGRPNLRYVYAAFLVSAACQQLQIVNEPDPDTCYFKIGIRCDQLMNQSRIFSDAFGSAYVGRSFINTLISYWISEHCHKLKNESEATTDLTQENNSLGLASMSL